jgi:hypothetical protein
VHNKIVSAIICLIAVTMFSLAGCGGGGGGNAPNNETTKAVAGLPQNVVSGSVVALDGSQSTGAAGNLITYQWSIISKPAGSRTILINPADVNPTFTADMPGEYTLRLAVSDAMSTSSSDVIISAAGPGSNSVPVANAGVPQNVKIGTFVTLDASASSDANGDLLTYSWSFQSMPTGSSALLSSATAARPTFITDLEGVYVLNLIVNDGVANSTAAVVTVTVSDEAQDAPPVANAGTAQSVIRGALVTLDGSAADTSGVPLKYSWSFTSKPAGSMAVLSSTTVAKPTFRADVSGTYVLNLVVSNDESNSRAAIVTITASANNAKPVAYAGFNRSVVTGTLVMLDGSRSSDANGDALTYNWAFTSRPAGSSAILSSSTAVKPTFTADVSGDYVVNLTVNDGTVNSSAVTVTITSALLNTTPVANAGASSRSVVAGDTVNLDGTLSYDVDGSPLTYSWSLSSIPVGSTAVLSSTTAVRPSFTADKAGVYQATLIVNDGTASSVPAAVTITAVAPYIELSSVGFYGDDILSLPYSQSAVSTPTLVSGAATLASFKLTAFGANYTISNLSVTSSSGAVIPSFENLSNGLTITNGNQVSFSLKSSSTSGATVNVSYSFTITEAVTGAVKTFSYSASLTTN